MLRRLWLRKSPTDGDVGSSIREGAERQADRLLHFREKEFGDDTTAANTIEELVEAVSNRGSRIRRPWPYIVVSFFRRMNAKAKRLPAVNYVAPEKLERVAVANDFDDLDMKLLWKEVQDRLSPEERQFLMAVVADSQTWVEAGKSLHLSPGAVRKRYGRLISDIRKRIANKGMSAGGGA